MDEGDHRDRHEGNKVHIALSIGGQVLAEVGLSRMEFEMIRLRGIEDALGSILRKDPRLSREIGMVSLIMEEIRAGRYTDQEAGRKEEDT